MTKLADRQVIKLDVDGRYGRPLRYAEIAARLVRAQYRLAWLAQRRSPSGRGWHIWVRVVPTPRTAVEIVALQLLLGSDPRREAYALTRARQVDRGRAPPISWNVLYRPVTMLP